jgi:hypothetical protein
VPESGGSEDMGEWFAGLEKRVNRIKYILREGKYFSIDSTWFERDALINAVGQCRC